VCGKKFELSEERVSDALNFLSLIIGYWCLAFEMILRARFE